jgi:hypothetical protein
MQYIISMMQVNIFKYAIFKILYNYCLTEYLTISCSKGTLHTVRHRHHHVLVPPHWAIHPPHTSIPRRSIKLIFCIQPRISILNMHDLIFFMLQTSQSSQAPSMQRAGSPAAGAPTAWPSPPPTGFWPHSGPGYWRLPLQPYPSQPRGPPPPQTGQGYWPPPPSWGSPLGGQAALWGSPPRGQAAPPFGSPPLRTTPLRPTTFTPPTVR